MTESKAAAGLDEQLRQLGDRHGPLDVALAATALSNAAARATAQPQADHPDPPDTGAGPGLVLMLIEFDENGSSIGRSWPVDDPTLADHLRHLSTHLGAPMTDASNSELDQTYLKVDPTT